MEGGIVKVKVLFWAAFGARGRSVRGLVCLAPGFRSAKGWGTQAALLFPLAPGVRAMPNVKPPPVSRTKLRWFGIVLLAASLFMFVSIILKTAMKGP